MPALPAAWPHGRLAQLALLLLCILQVMASKLEDVIYKRNEYWENCTRILASTYSTRTGIYCNGTFDFFACWPHSPVGNVSVPCPPYLPWITTGNTGYVYRECVAGGAWRTLANSTEPWRDQSECVNMQHFNPEDYSMQLQSALHIISFIGYSLSLLSLTLALLILALLRKLHCTRNYIHMNLFMSFIMRAVAVITKQIVLLVMYANLPTDENGWNDYSNSPMSVLCKAAEVSMHYFVGGNIFWLLVEGIFLHTSLFTAMLTKRRLLKRYVFIGWGTPLLFVVPWAVTKAVYEDHDCWSIKSLWIWWIIRGPITLAVVVIFYMFIKIMKLLLSKLKADQVKSNDYSLARATLVLIPLLGIHEVVFTFFMDEYLEEGTRYIRNFINLTLSSFQGLFVAVLYCFANGEVQAELKKRWQLFLFAKRFDTQKCLQGAGLKHAWKCSRRRPTHRANGREQQKVQQMPLAVKSTWEGRKGLGSRLECYTRGSLSSSEGDMTMGETMEEILEESEF